MRERYLECMGGRLVLAGLVMGALGGMARADSLIFDNFNDVGLAASLQGRTSTISNGNTWVAPVSGIVGNGLGGVSANTTMQRTASIDLGTDYLSNNAALYDLSMDITQPTNPTPGSSWVGLGFMQNTTVGDNLVGNDGSPWLIYRYNGEVVVFAGPGVDSRRTPTSPVIKFMPGVAHHFEIELDTRQAHWTLNAFVDGAALDLNGGAAGDTFTYGNNPTLSHYVGLSTGINGSGTIATVDNFQLTQAVPLPQTAAMALVGFAGLLVTRRGR